MIEMVCRVVERVFEREMWATDVSMLKEGCIVQDGDDVVYTLEGLTTLIKRWEQKSIKRTDLAIVLKTLGFKDKRIQIGEKRLRAWVIPLRKLEEGLIW